MSMPCLSGCWNVCASSSPLLAGRCCDVARTAATTARPPGPIWPWGTRVAIGRGRLRASCRKRRRRWPVVTLINCSASPRPPTLRKSDQMEPSNGPGMSLKHHLTGGSTGFGH
jgi:hypothetical protein